MMWTRRIRLLLSPQARSFSATTARAPAPPSTGSTGGEGGGGGVGRDTLGRRLLSLIHPKRSAVITLRKWAEEGKSIQKYQLNRVVRELRKFNRFKHALEKQICSHVRASMKKQYGQT